MKKITRKFLVSADIRRWLKEQESKMEKMEQYYTVFNMGTVSYCLKRFPDTYTSVTVNETGNQEITPITEKEYFAHRSEHLGRILTKQSYTLTLEKSDFVVEVYLKSLEGIYTLTGYFEDEKALHTSATLEVLQPFILKEIDKDEKYSDHALALNEQPMEYNLQQFFKKIDAFESPNLFFWQVPQRVYVRDGVALVLYRNIRLLNYYKVNFHKKHFSASLHRLRVLLRRSATLLETFSDLFSPKIRDVAIGMLLHYYEETKMLRYLYFLNELCSTREDIKLTLYSELKSLITQEEEKVIGLLQSKSFAQMIELLTTEIEREEKQKYVSLKAEIRRVVKAHLESFETLLAETREGYDDALLEVLYNKVDTLQTLIEDFFHIIGEKSSAILVDEINILLKPLREYRNCKERAIILNDIKAQSETRTLDVDPILCEHEEALKNKTAHALKLLRSSKFYV